MRAGPIVVGLVAAASLAASTPRAAEACEYEQCYGWMTVPFFTVVPRNAELLFDGEAREVSLHGREGEVPVTVDESWQARGYRHTQVRPRIALAPETNYVLRLDGRELEFRTMKSLDLDGQGAVAIAGVELQSTFGPDLESETCRSRARILGVTVWAPHGTAAYEITLETRGNSVSDVVSRDSMRALASTCGRISELPPGEPFCLEVRGRDFVGNVGPPDRYCAVAPDQPAGECGDGADIPASLHRGDPGAMLATILAGVLALLCLGAALLIRPRPLRTWR